MTQQQTNESTPSVPTSVSLEDFVGAVTQAVVRALKAQGVQREFQLGTKNVQIESAATSGSIDTKGATSSTSSWRIIIGLVFD